MAVYTSMSLADASRITQAHGLGDCLKVTPIAAGSVNSNFFVATASGRWFVRIYEEQDVDGVAYEWALLDHLRQQGVPVPRRVQGTQPGELCVMTKPTAVFEAVDGEECCQAMVTKEHAEVLGTVLANMHQRGTLFGTRKQGRFTRESVRERLAVIEAHPKCREQRELADTLVCLRSVLDEVEDTMPDDLPTGVIHGDLFRDNVRWRAGQGAQKAEIAAVLDWESASDGVWLFDVAVCVQAWCYGDAFDWGLARAFVCAYDAVRCLTEAEWGALRVVSLEVAVRFATTRITDFHLREGSVGERVQKDYRRFVQRLEALRALSPAELRARLSLSLSLPKASTARAPHA